MLLSFSPEAGFVLTLFELVLSGLSFLILIWIGLWDQDRRAAGAFRLLTLAFALFVVAFAFLAAYCRITVYSEPAERPVHYWVLLGSDVARLLGTCCLMAAYLIQVGRKRYVPVLGAAAAFAIALGIALFSRDAAGSVASIVPVTTARLAEAAIVALGLPWIARAGFGKPAAALALLALGRAVAANGALHPPSTEFVWGFDYLLTIAGLALLAFAIERESRQASLRFFLRLNLTFVILASSLVLAVMQIERRQFLDLAALHAQDLAEFVRGHMLYYSGRGDPPEHTLTHDDVIDKLVAEFGRYPDLRRVQASLQGHSMALSINRDGEIEQELWTGDRRRVAPVSRADFAVTPLIDVPIVSGGRPIGNVQLDHSLTQINERIGRQMRLIFGVFTLFVGIGSAMTGIVFVAADRTIRRQYEEIERTQRRLSVAERLASIGAVADGVAHEINNPAGILVARTDYLLSTIEGRPAYAEICDDLDTIRRQAQRIAKTVRDLLTFTRPTPLYREVLDLRPVVESALALVRPLVPGSRIVFEYRTSMEPCRVCGDRDRLEQIFTNLLTNAAQAIRGDGRVVVTTSVLPDGGVEAVVRDSGIGIAPEHLDRIFDPFFTTKAPGAGTGLGLSLAYAVIRDHGGAIDVSSTPGVGTEFRVKLPPPTDCRPGFAPEQGHAGAAANSLELSRRVRESTKR
jgi:signal transduction histidine kinase